jgi:uncharacterized protein YndB with AHSA1/START domain
MRIQNPALMRAVIRRRVRVRRERVFQAWTEATHLQRWFFPTLDQEAVAHAEVDLRIGGRYQVRMCAPGGAVMASVGGTYHDVHPPTRLVFSWRWEAPEPEAAETLVTVELHEVEDGTEIIITHERCPQDTEAHTIGWICCLDRLVRLVEAAALSDALTTASDACHA